MRMAPDSSGAPGVKQQASHEGHKGESGSRRMNEIAKLGLLINFGEAHLKHGIKRIINGRLDDGEIPDISL